MGRPHQCSEREGAALPVGLRALPPVGSPRNPESRVGTTWRPGDVWETGVPKCLSAAENGPGREFAGRRCPVLILIVDLDECVTTRVATPWEWLVSHVRAAKLDRDIAAGASADGSPLLALRAQALVQPSMRRALARTVGQLLAEATGTGSSAPHAAELRIPIRRDTIMDAADALQMLIERLLTRGPVPARGVAQVRLLLTDGAGPLYYPSDAADLRAAVDAAIEQLEPLSNW